MKAIRGSRIVEKNRSKKAVQKNKSRKVVEKSREQTDSANGCRG